MVKPDYRGARGSNAGDDFHELWTLRQALSLLDSKTNLSTIVAEGVRAEDEKGKPLDTWDGVDCTLYYGGDTASEAEQIVIAQLKYSSANPDSIWTISRLTSATNIKKNNSIITKLAKAFETLMEMRPDLVESRKLIVKLVSNQPVDPNIVSALSNPKKDSKSVLEKLRKSSNLTADKFNSFKASLDFSECGHESRFALEERIILTISDWKEDDARTSTNDLLRFIRQKMMPEAKGEIISRQSIMAQLGISDARALFPCESAIKKVDNIFPRDVSIKVIQMLSAGNQRICLHGSGGCGKTTILQDVEKKLPKGSTMVVYDCYGGGRYLDSDAFRHKPVDAFIQLSKRV